MARHHCCNGPSGSSGSQLRLICDDGTFVGEPQAIVNVLQWMEENSEPEVFGPDIIPHPPVRHLWDDIVAAAHAAPAVNQPFVPMGRALQSCIDSLHQGGAAEIANVDGGLIVKTLEEFGTLFVRTPPIQKVQASLTAALGLSTFRALLDRHSGNSDADKAAFIRISCCSHEGASRWISALPTSSASILTDVEFRTAVCMLMGLDVYPINPNDPPVPCVHAKECQACRHIDLRYDPFHALSCTREQKSPLGRFGQHEHVLKLLKELARLCGIFATPKTGEFVKAGQRRPDLYLEFNSAGAAALADVVGTHPTSESYLAENKSNPWKSTNNAVDAKHNRYKDIATDVGIPIVAVAFETYGGLHKGDC